jgi:hypothetical protein
MKKKILIIMPFALIACLITSAVARAQYGLTEAGKTSGLLSNALTKAGDIPTILGYLISTVLSLVGIFFFLLILYAGFIWMTAAGSTERVDSAKKKMTAAVVGLVIILSAYALTSFIFDKFIQEPASQCKDKCTPSQLCVNGECVNKCDHIYKEYGGKCIDITSDSCDGKVLSGLCKGSLNNKCCIPHNGYKQFERFLETNTNKASDIIAPMPEKNACEKGGNFCVSKSACLSSYNGQDIGQNGCATGDICCKNCINSMGGNCTTDQNRCMPDTSAITGYCFGVFEGQYCCTGVLLPE